MYLLILFMLSALPVVLVATFIYMKDKNKEPSKLLLKLFLGGFLSVIITLFLSLIFKNFLVEYEWDIKNYPFNIVLADNIVTG